MILGKIQREVCFGLIGINWGLGVVRSRYIDFIGACDWSAHATNDVVEFQGGIVGCSTRLQAGEGRD